MDCFARAQMIQAAAHGSFPASTDQLFTQTKVDVTRAHIQSLSFSIGKLERSLSKSCKWGKDTRSRQSFRTTQDRKSTCKLSQSSTQITVRSLQKEVCALDPRTCCSQQQKTSLPKPSGPVPDKWVEDSVLEIVRNITEAPFMHLVFDSNDSTIRTERQRVSKDNLSTVDRWRAVKDNLSKAAPDGLILVRHLDGEAVGGCWMADLVHELASSTEEIEHYEGNGTDMWGILVLGRSIARSACYILKTTRVASSFGTCTQFCLTRAKCFGPAWHDQVQSAWLLQTDCRNQ